MIYLNYALAGLAIIYGIINFASALLAARHEASNTCYLNSTLYFILAAIILK